MREEKRKYLEHLKQWSKRREDMECDDLKVTLASRKGACGFCMNP